MNRGYIKLWRKVEDSGLTLQLKGFWLHCLIKATFCERKTTVCGREVILHPGQFVYGRKRWSTELSVSEKAVRELSRSCLRRGMIRAIIRASTFTVFEIINWDIYQGKDENEGQHLGQQKGQHLGQQKASTRATSKEGQEGEEGKKKSNTPLTPRGGESGYTESFEQFWTLYPKPIGKAAAFKSWKTVPKKHEGVGPTKIIEALKTQLAADHFRGSNGEQFYPLPATWLNQGRWDDVLKTAPAPPGPGLTLAEKFAALHEKGATQ